MTNRFNIGEAVSRHLRNNLQGKRFASYCLTTVATCALAAAVAPASAAEFDIGGGWKGSSTVTTTYSIMARTAAPDDGNYVLGADAIPVLMTVSTPNAVNANRDDGGENFDKGDITSNTLKVSADIDISRRLDSGDNIGFFGRALAFYDFKIMHGGTAFDGNALYNNESKLGGDPTDFTDGTKERAGRDAKILDAFVYYEGDIGSTPVTLRIGRQVISWGENAFIQTGIANAINPADITQATLPGTEVKDILLPQGAAYATVGLTNALTLEGYYQFEWERTIAPAYGTFFSTNDFISEDGSRVAIAPTDIGHPAEGAVGWVRDRNLHPDNFGQWGVALRYFSETLNSTDFGFYYVHYHSKLPTVGVSGPPGPFIPTRYYNIGYLDDLQLFGFSWNTVLGETAVSGEIAYHLDAQVQTTQFGGPAVQLGASAPGTDTALVSTREDLLVSQVTLNRNLSQMPFISDLADSVGALIEFGSVYTPELEHGDIFRGTELIDQFAWGYKARLNLSYFNGVGRFITPLSGTDLNVGVNFSHDVSGDSAIPAGSFTQDAKAVGLSLTANWQNTIEATLAVNQFFDSRVADRDNVSLALKYRF